MNYGLCYSGLLTLLLWSFLSLLVNGCASVAKVPFLSSDLSSSGPVPIRSEAMGRYLENNGLNTPYLVSASTGKIQKGEIFREHTRDQRGRWTLATIWIDKSDGRILHIMTKRDVDCPTCKGSGTRNSNKKIESRVSVDFRCLKCDGSGIIENHVEECRYILTEADLEARGGFLSRNNPASSSAIDYKPSMEEQNYIDGLVSDDAKIRLDACRWLDTHYLKKDVSFHQYLSMLRKARWIESNQEGQTLYQFWAGKEVIPEFFYYRVLVDTKRGKIIKKGFVNSSADGDVDGNKALIKDSAGKIKNWFTDGWGESE